MLLCIRAAPVHCSWIHQSKSLGLQWRKYGTESSLENLSAFSHVKHRISRPLHQSFRLFATWKSGDPVTVDLKSSRVQGIISEVRGSGWYSVAPFNDPDNIVKCRTSQLNHLDTKSMDDTAIKGPVQIFSPSNLSKPIVHPDPGMQPTFPPPPPTIYDLDSMILHQSNATTRRDQEYLEQIRHHSKFEKWVVFTDLHCSPASLDTSLKVLTRVHELAIEHNAGVLFLGDFWHHRGTLRVDCLNSVLEHFRTWTVPMIMIPGNHDQVTLDGHNHGLTPFENAYRVGNVSGPLIFSYPTKFRDALFVPHIRDIAIMESILQTPFAQEAKAIFVHAEVTGALMNDLIVSLNGIPPASFPPHKQIYSGHFHKPHIVKATNGDVQIEYLGSPYETTLAEAQQAKTLAILNTDWQCVEYVPIDIGRRHFKASSWEEVLNLQFHKTGADSTSVRKGDRIVATIPYESVDQKAMDVDDHLKHLRSNGVMVEVREVKTHFDQDVNGKLIGSSSSELEEMNPESTWRAYLEEEEMQRKTLNSEDSQVLLNVGIEVLNELETLDGGEAVHSQQQTDFVLTKVSVEGFGPFSERCVYPLSDRGLVLLKGTNNDVGSDSNGTGKTSLAMAALWALTGSLDPRRAQDGRVSDVVHDDSKVARVTLDGLLNGTPFTISRSKTASKSGLVFYLDGEDLTAQSSKETQALLEEHLGINIQILSRTMFHGQHALNDLLEATDAKFKEELAMLVPLKLWQKAASLSRAKSRDASKRKAELEGMMELRSRDLKRLSSKQEQISDEVSQKRNVIINLENEFKQLSEAAKDKSIEIDLSDMEKRLSNITASIDETGEKITSTKIEGLKALSPLQDKLSSIEKLCEDLTRQRNDFEREEYALSLNLKIATQKKLEVKEKWSISGDDLTDSDSMNNISSPDICPTCQQPLADGRLHEEFEERMKIEIERAFQGYAELVAQNEIISKNQKDILLDLQQKTQERLLAKEELDRVSSEWQVQMEQLQEELQTKERMRNSLSSQMAAAIKQSQYKSHIESALAKIQMEESSMEYIEGSLSGVKLEVKQLHDDMKDMKMEAKMLEQQSRTMTELADRFGQRGVQTFVLQNIVDALEICSQSYLEDLSDGSQKLELSLDAGDRISRTAYVSGSDGIYKERPLATLSGGQWRRCSLALTFGFAELCARRGKFRPSVIVLDEPLTHLDHSGRARVGEVIRKMLQREVGDGNDTITTTSTTTSSTTALKSSNIQAGLSMTTIIIILQDLAAEELDESFDYIDEVIKTDSISTVKVDGWSA